MAEALPLYSRDCLPLLLRSTSSIDVPHRFSNRCAIRPMMYFAGATVAATYHASVSPDTACPHLYQLRNTFYQFLRALSTLKAINESKLQAHSILRLSEPAHFWHVKARM